MSESNDLSDISGVLQELLETERIEARQQADQSKNEEKFRKLSGDNSEPVFVSLSSSHGDKMTSSLNTSQKLVKRLSTTSKKVRKYWKCRQCGLLFAKNMNLDQHMKTCSIQKPIFTALPSMDHSYPLVPILPTEENQNSRSKHLDNQVDSLLYFVVVLISS